MATSVYISELATGIWQDLGEPATHLPSYIQTKLVSPYFLGKLNVAIATSYTIVDSDIVPVLGAEEQGIYALMYKVEYYAGQISKMLSGYTSSSGGSAWIELSDGDGRVRRASPTEMAKVYASQKNQGESELSALIGKYRMNNSKAKTVDYLTINNNNTNPTPPENDYKIV